MQAGEYILSKRKALYPTSNRIRVEKLTWIKKRFTKRFAEHVYRLTAITTNTEAGWFLGLDDETVYRIDRATLEEMAAHKLYPVTVPSYMSLDEVAWKKMAPLRHQCGCHCNTQSDLEP